MPIFVTADNHFGHANIIKLSERPFASVDEMDEVMIENWNSVVHPLDIVYHLADFSLGNADYAANMFLRLNGRIYVLNYFWHHDRNWIGKLEKGKNFISAAGYPVNLLPPMVVIKALDTKVTLTHYPLEEWEASFHDGIHLHGHCHGNLPTKKNRLDVGVDCHRFFPIDIEEAIELARIQK